MAALLHPTHSVLFLIFLHFMYKAHYVCMYVLTVACCHFSQFYCFGLRCQHLVMSANKMELSGIYVRWVRCKMYKEIWEDISAQQERKKSYESCGVVRILGQRCLWLVQCPLLKPQSFTWNWESENHHYVPECPAETVMYQCALKSVFSTFHYLPYHFLLYFSWLMSVNL